MRLLVSVGLLCLVVQFCAAGTDGVDQATASFELALANVPASVRPEFRALAAKALQPRHPALAQRFSDPPAPSVAAGDRVDPAATPAAASIVGNLDQLERLSTDADRARLTIALVSDIRALPDGISKVLLAWNLRVEANSKGNPGPDTLAAVAAVFAEAINGAPAAGMYVDLAAFIRYDHVRIPPESAGLNAAFALLELQERLHEEADFTLTALDGKSYSLSGLRGKVVMLNFWATSCQPCLKEMPDMERLYREFGSKGLIVLAVSDDKREAVDKFVAEGSYTVPVLLDPDGKAYRQFDVEGIPQTFVFDRGGKLVAQAIEMCTGDQFHSMLRAAGLQ